MSNLSLAFFGPPEVRHDGRPVGFRTRKTLGLLAYLAVAGGRHSREKLMSFFWPESPEAQARASLRNSLAFLRNALQDSPEDRHLRVDQNSLGFDFTSSFELDLQILERAFKLVQATPSGATTDARPQLLSQLQNAVRVYRGEFLEGFSLEASPDFEDWVRLQREIWHQRMNVIFNSLSKTQLDGGEFLAGIETAIRWTGHDLVHELAYRRLMQMYLTVSDRQSALQTFEKCRAVLAEQFQARPAPETQALAELARQQDGSAPEPSPEAISGQAGTPDRALPGLPMVGRAARFAALSQAYAAVRQRGPQVVILQGEAGAGKTRLAREFTGWASGQGGDVLLGRAFETGGRLPYQPVVESLRPRLERENAPEDLLGDTWLAELSLVLPELRDRYPDLPSPSGDLTGAVVRLFEAITRLFEALAKRRPVILFVDDVHRLDSASADLLLYAGRRWRESGVPILLILGLRSEALIANPALAAWLGELEKELYAQNLPLEPLTVGDTAQLVREIAAGSQTNEARREAFAHWLYKETGGQPFFIVETLKMLVERGLLILQALPGKKGWAVDYEATFQKPGWTLNQDQGWLAPVGGVLPHGVREMIRARLGQLAPATFTLLAAGAVLGQDFSFEKLCEVGGLAEDTGLPALDEALTGRLLVERAGAGKLSGGAYVFTHDKIRDVIYTEAGEARRRIFHRRAFVALEKSGAPSAELAYHAHSAGLPAQAFHFMLAAGNEAMRLFALRDALVQYEQAMGLLAELPGFSEIPVTETQQLYLQVGRAYELANNRPQASATYEAMLRFGREAGLTETVQVALTRLAALTAQDPRNLNQAQALLDQAQPPVSDEDEANPTLEEAEAEWNQAQLCIYRCDAVGALSHGERALEAARKLDAQGLIGRCLNVLAYANLDAGRWDESERIAGEACALYRGLGDPAMEADSLTAVAISQINRGKPQAAIRTAQTAHNISLEIENMWGQISSSLPLGQGLLETGEYDAALEVLEKALAIARSQNLYLLMANCLVVLGMVRRATFEPEAAIAAHQEFLKMSEPVGLQPLTEMISSELCADYTLAGNREKAQEFARRSIEARTEIFLLSTRLAIWYEAEALAQAGELERAIRDVQAYGELIGKSPRYRIAYLRARAVLAEYSGETGEGLRDLQEAALLAEEIGLPGELWPILAAMGERYQRRGEKQRATLTFGRARVVLESIAAGMKVPQRRTSFLSSAQVQSIFSQSTQL